jgi:hypothetical protein
MEGLELRLYSSLEDWSDSSPDPEENNCEQISTTISHAPYQSRREAALGGQILLMLGEEIRPKKLRRTAPVNIGTLKLLHLRLRKEQAWAIPHRSFGFWLRSLWKLVLG